MKKMPNKFSSIFQRKNGFVLALIALGVTLTALFGSPALAQLFGDRSASRIVMAQVAAPAAQPSATPAVVKQKDQEEEGATRSSMPGNANCWCSITCNSTCGQTWTQVPTNQAWGPADLSQTSPKDRATCRQRCNQALIDTSNAPFWNLKGVVTCTGSSHVGTNTNMALATSSTVNRGVCAASGGPATACCPPVGQNDITSLFSRLINGPANAPFGLAYVASTAFDNKMKASAALGALNGGCSPITVTHTLRNTSVSGNPVVATLTVVYTGTTTSAPTTTGSWTGLSINTNYEVRTTVLCPSGVSNYYASTCPARGFKVAWLYDPVLRAAPGANAGPAAARERSEPLN